MPTLSAATEIPDLLTLDLPVGGRVMVVSDLRLDRDPSPAQAAAAVELAAAVAAATGPGVLIVAGNLLEAGADPAAALAAHPRLVNDIARYAAGPGRRVVVLPGTRDARLAWSEPAQSVLTERLGASIALAAELDVHTGAGSRRIRVEPGHNLDRLCRFQDPRNPLDSPFAQHIRDELLPSIRRQQTSGWARTGWLSGMEQLDQPAAVSRFIASRLVYRRLARSAWLLLVPVVVALVLRLPALLLHSARSGTLSTRVTILVVATVVELILLILLAAAALRRTNRALSALALDEGDSDRDPNDAPRALARDLVTAGYSGLITGHTCRPELAHLGRGFYANAGCGTEVVTEVPSRMPGLGLPSVYLGHRDLGWVEVEAGNDLHVRLLHVRQDLPGATLIERAMARRAITSGSGELRAEVVASYPQGDAWPPQPAGQIRDRRIRRLAALVVFVAGFVSLVSAVAEPVRDRLNVVTALFPLAVPETAAALAALAGLGLIVLARGIRRGQRRAWVVCLALLGAVAVLHLIKGVDVEETLIAVGAAVFLWINRASFSAKTDVARLPRGVVMIAAVTGLTVVAGTLGLELSSWVHAHRHGEHRIAWPQAMLASVERMVGIYNVRLPDPIGDFFSPAMTTVGVGLFVALLVVLFRPVVQRHHQDVERRREQADRPAARPVHEAPLPTPGSDGVVLEGEAGLIRARGVVERHGSGTLDYFALRPDKQFFLWGDTVVAHAVYGGVCLVSPDPIGPVAERDAAWGAFRRYVDEHGWALGGLGVGEEWLPLYRGTGMHDLYVGDEGIVRAGRFTLEGGRFKGLRQAVNRIAKYGYRITFHDPARLDPDLRDALLELMTKSRRGDVERGFSMTLGRVFDPADTGLLLAVVHGPPGDGEEGGAGGPGGDGVAGKGAHGGARSNGGGLGPPVAFCQFVPAPGIGGYSLDLMRRDNGEHPNGLMDFAIVETIRELKSRGGDGLGLNFATMRAVLAGEAGEGVTQRVQAWMLRRMGDSMQIESLWKFNAKFDPDWQPRYAVYDAPENMLAVAIAVARAESFWELPVIGRFLTPAAARSGEAPPAS